MDRYDLTPLFRTSVGFDRMARLMDAALTTDRPQRSYPPYNIVKTDEDRYQISIAVAGFTEADLEIQSHNGRLTIRGRTADAPEGVEYLHRGIAGRAFERTFQLADHIVIEEATLDHGLLHIGLRQEVPEALKPRNISIRTLFSEPQAAK